MPWHCSIYTSSAFNANLSDSLAVMDGIMTIQNNHFLPASQMNLYGGWFSGVNLTRAYLYTPRTRQVVPPAMIPIQASATPPDRPHILDRRRQPIILNAVEEVQIMVNAGGTVAAPITSVLLWGPSMEAAPTGEIYTLHGTSVTPVLSRQWSQVQPVWEQNLPAGTYALVGSHVQSVNAIAHRFTFKDQVWRPGFTSVPDVTFISEPSYYNGGWGTLGRFNTYTLPNIEVFCNGTDAAHDLYLNIIRVA